METTVVCWGYLGNNGKEHGNYYNQLHVLWNRLRCAVPSCLFSMDFGYRGLGLVLDRGVWDLGFRV